ncbi:hypothetical protein HHI36_018267 [Cryptolaemus montrouzieri]|uniref:UV radiation resistance-associated gene protein n=1 Tax=Cryptolaemus montrouzieri TaxID=559131 RepID=A0ABD2NZN6_9CUCU
MNFSPNEIILEARRGRQWSPLISQQIRLRHINQVWCFNLKSEVMRTGSFYFTLHVTAMSAPFFTSERTHGPHPKWQDLSMNNFPSASAIVLRIWQHEGDTSEHDTILLTWGVHLSGLIYIGSKVTDVQPSLFNSNTVIFYMFCGFFTGANCIKDNIQKLPHSLLEHSNMIDFPNNKTIFKCISSVYLRGEMKRSYTVEKLRKLHYLEVMIKNKSLDVHHIEDKISELDVLLQKPDMNDIPLSPMKSQPQLLTMNCLNRMLQEKPTKVQKQEMFKMNKEIEIAKFRSKLLSQEREKKLIKVRQLRKNHATLVESNCERESALMEGYHSLNKEKEKLKDYQKVLLQHRELLIHTNSQLQHRKRQLLQQLLWIYPIKQISDKSYIINGMHLPNADVLSDVTDDGVSVALGYVTHILTMCSTFLQVPLRYPVTHYGSRSTVTDQISANLPEKEFPLFTKGKDRMQFTYGVYLLNKNIAQLRWLYFMHTPDLKLTLPNLLNFLQGYKEFKQERFMLLKSASNSQMIVPESMSSDDGSRLSPSNLPVFNRKLPTLVCYEPCGHSSDPILDCIRQEKRVDRSESPCCNILKKNKGKSSNGQTVHTCPGLSEILSIPEAFLSKQMSSDSFKNYMSISSCKEGQGGCCGEVNLAVAAEIVTTESKNTQSNCDIHLSTNNSNISKEYSLAHCESVEEGTDLLNPKLTLTDLVVDVNNAKDTENTEKEVNPTPANIVSIVKERISAEDSDTKLVDSVESTAKNFISKEQQEFMQNWLRTGPALVCSDRSLYPDEYLGSTSSVQAVDSPLTARTDALLTTKSFNLVKPKH